MKYPKIIRTFFIERQNRFIAREGYRVPALPVGHVPAGQEERRVVASICRAILPKWICAKIVRIEEAVAG